MLKPGHQTFIVPNKLTIIVTAVDLCMFIVPVSGQHMLFLLIMLFFQGSGKTFTMMGSQNQTGLIPRLCDELFDKISKVSYI